ncbi:MAG: hypothetical protein ABFE07_01975 [Armatimonadia bacterium]
MHGEPYWIWIVFILFTLIVAIAAAVSAKKRRAAWAALAAEMGWQYSPNDPFGTRDALTQPLFQHGHSRKVSNVVYGQYQGVPIRCFDYRYTVGSGKNSHTYYFTCALLGSPLLFKPLVIRPEGIGDKIGHFLGVHDVQFESDEFNRRYAVQCQDARFAFDVVHARTMELLLSTDGLAVEASGFTVLIHGTSGQARLAFLGQEIRRMLDFGRAFIALLPDYLQQVDVAGVELPQGRPTTEGLEWMLR